MHSFLVLNRGGADTATTSKDPGLTATPNSLKKRIGNYLFVPYLLYSASWATPSCGIQTQASKRDSFSFSILIFLVTSLNFIFQPSLVFTSKTTKNLK